MSTPFVIERKLKATPEKIWKALTEKELMKKWYFDLDNFVAETGFEFQFYGTGHDGQKYLHHCKITEVIPGKKLKYSWSYEGIEGMSYVSFELIPEGEHTLVRLTHEGLETFPKNNPDFARNSFENGWTSIIGESLKNYIEN